MRASGKGGSGPTKKVRRKPRPTTAGRSVVSPSQAKRANQYSENAARVARNERRSAAVSAYKSKGPNALSAREQEIALRTMAREAATPAEWAALQERSKTGYALPTLGEAVQKQKTTQAKPETKSSSNQESGPSFLESAVGAVGGFLSALPDASPETNLLDNESTLYKELEKVKVTIPAPPPGLDVQGALSQGQRPSRPIKTNLAELAREGSIEVATGAVIGGGARATYKVTKAGVRRYGPKLTRLIDRAMGEVGDPAARAISEDAARGTGIKGAAGRAANKIDEATAPIRNSKAGQTAKAGTEKVNAAKNAAGKKAGETAAKVSEATPTPVKKVVRVGTAPARHVGRNKLAYGGLIATPSAVQAVKGGNAGDIAGALPAAAGGIYEGLTTSTGQTLENTAAMIPGFVTAAGGMAANAGLSTKRLIDTTVPGGDSYSAKQIIDPTYNFGKRNLDETLKMLEIYGSGDKERIARETSKEGGYGLSPLFVVAPPIIKALGGQGRRFIRDPLRARAAVRRAEGKPRMFALKNREREPGPNNPDREIFQYNYESRQRREEARRFAQADARISQEQRGRLKQIIPFARKASNGIEPIKRTVMTNKGEKVQTMRAADTIGMATEFGIPRDPVAAMNILNKAEEQLTAVRDRQIAAKEVDPAYRMPREEAIATLEAVQFFKARFDAIMENNSYWRAKEAFKEYASDQGYSRRAVLMGIAQLENIMKPEERTPTAVADVPGVPADRVSAEEMFTRQTVVENGKRVKRLGTEEKRLNELRRSITELENNNRQDKRLPKLRRELITLEKRRAQVQGELGQLDKMVARQENAPGVRATDETKRQNLSQELLDIESRRAEIGSQFKGKQSIANGAPRMDEQFAARDKSTVENELNPEVIPTSLPKGFTMRRADEGWFALKGDDNARFVPRFDTYKGERRDTLRVGSKTPDGAFGYVIYKGKKPVGSITYEVDPYGIRIGTIFIEKEFRGKRLLDSLMEPLTALARERNGTIDAFVWDNRTLRGTVERRYAPNSYRYEGLPGKTAPNAGRLAPVRKQVLGDLGVDLQKTDRSGDMVEFVSVQELLDLRDIDRTPGAKGAERNRAEFDKFKKALADNEPGISDPVLIDYSPETGKALLAEGNNRVSAAAEMGLEVLPAKVMVNSRARKGSFQATKPYDKWTTKPPADYIPTNLRPSEIGLTSYRQVGVRPPDRATAAALRAEDKKLAARSKQLQTELRAQEKVVRRTSRQPVRQDDLALQERRTAEQARLDAEITAKRQALAELKDERVAADTYLAQMRVKAKLLSKRNKKVRGELRNINRAPGGYDESLLAQFEDDVRARMAEVGYDEPGWRAQADAARTSPMTDSVSSPAVGGAGAKLIDPGKTPGDRMRVGTLLDEGRVREDFETQVHASILNPVAKRGIFAVWRDLLNEKGIRVRGKSQLTMEQWKRLVDEGLIDPNDIALVPVQLTKRMWEDPTRKVADTEIETTLDGIKNQSVSETEALAIRMEDAQKAKELGIDNEETGRLYEALPRESFKEAIAQSDSSVAGWQKTLNQLNSYTNRLILGTSPAWAAIQVVAESLQGASAISSTGIPTPVSLYKLYFGKMVKEWRKRPPKEQWGLASMAGESLGTKPNLTDVRTSLASGEIDSAQFALNGLNATPLGRAMKSVGTLRALGDFDQWKGGRIRQGVAAHHIDKQLNGFLSSYRSAWKASEKMYSELKGKTRQEQLDYFDSNPRAAREVMSYLEDTMGEWRAMTSRERGPASLIAFYPFLRMSLRVLFRGLPRRHPFKTSMLYLLGTTNAQVLEDFLHGDPAYFTEWAKIPLYGGDNGEITSTLNLARAAPAANAIIEAMGDPSGFPDNLLRVGSPALGPFVTLATGKTSFGSLDEEGMNADEVMGSRALAVVSQLLSMAYPARLLDQSNLNVSAKNDNEGGKADAVGDFVGGPLGFLADFMNKGENNELSGIVRKAGPTGVDAVLRSLLPLLPVGAKEDRVRSQVSDLLDRIDKEPAFLEALDAARKARNGDPNNADLQRRWRLSADKAKDSIDRLAREYGVNTSIRDSLYDQINKILGEMVIPIKSEQPKKKVRRSKAPTALQAWNQNQTRP